MSSPLPAYPSSFDPAIHLHSDAADLPPSSADLDALHTHQLDTMLEKSRAGIVIQHRAWKMGEAFRSDEEYEADTPVKKKLKLDMAITTPSLGSDATSPASSPPHVPKYPMASFSKRNTQNVSGSKPKMIGGFILDDDDDDDSLSSLTNEPIQLNGSLVEKSMSAPDYSSLGMCMDINKNMDTGPYLETTQSRLEKLLSHQESRTRHGRETGIKESFSATTCSGEVFKISPKVADAPMPIAEMIAARSTTAPGRAQKSYYGVDIHALLDQNSREQKLELSQAEKRAKEIPLPSIEAPSVLSESHTNKTLMWTEKYRAQQFTDLVGDERTHRQVLWWLKGWDPIVFPRAGRQRPKKHKFDGEASEERPHRKIMLLTGPPGLGKTTLAHVCARQAGYEVLEINASDERSRDVVKGRIRDCVGTENVRGINTKTIRGTVRKAGRPVCVVVDEVDGVFTGSGGSGEGGFIKALIDLINLDQKNSSLLGVASAASTTSRKKKKGDKFRLLRPLILICNDVYHPSLRPLRQANLAEIIHIRKPPLQMVVSRMKTIFQKEGFACDGDAVRRLCEATWGISGKKEIGSQSSGTGEGDIRGVMVVGEWVARKLRASLSPYLHKTITLSRQWVESNVIGDLSHGGGSARGLGRGGAKEVVERVFLDGAGFPKSTPADLDRELAGPGEARKGMGVAELNRKRAIDRLREMVDTSGECDRVLTDCFATYPSQPFQDDTFLSKPDTAYEWLHFYDALSLRVFKEQEWELQPYLSHPILAFHHLFSSPSSHSFSSGYDQKKWTNEDESDQLPFTGPRADFQSHEAQKESRSILSTLQTSLSIPLLRSFRSPEQIATDFMPYLVTMLSPAVKPVVVGGGGEQRGIASVRKQSERDMVRRAVGVMCGVGVTFSRGRIDSSGNDRFGGWVYRMEPAIDTLVSFETANKPSTATAPTRYAVRQVLDQEHQKALILQRNDARQARYRAGNPLGDADMPDLTSNKENMRSGKPAGTERRLGGTGGKRDFFGRIINEALPSTDAEPGVEEGAARAKRRKGVARYKRQAGNVWVSYHEGFSNAVRKPVTLDELMRGL
ncbi:MAG: hypothetical protein M1829_002192 [Trizodia sp. TS-e1964]|nr:MAG: hypothetical protein M1829_002192 [Trizodia sp. TS-e1964]